MHQPWLSASNAGMLLGICGAALILLSTIFGLISRRLARLGVARTLVSGGFVFLSICGVVTLAVGVIGWCCHQPTYIWCSATAVALAVLGSVTLGAVGINDGYRRSMKRAELQAMAQQLLSGTSSRILARSMPTNRWR